MTAGEAENARDEGRGRRGATLRSLLQLVEVVVIAFVLSRVVTAYIFTGTIIDGDSMNPSLFNGERVFITRLTLPDGVPERGDVVVFRYPLDPSREFVKRVIGLPGDEVEIRSGRVFVNGSFMQEDFQIIPDRSGYPPTRVPEGQIFVLGDNRPISDDSRYFGFVPLENIRGEVFLIYWPPSRVEWLGAGAGGY